MPGDAGCEDVRFALQQRLLMMIGANLNKTRRVPTRALTQLLFEPAGTCCDLFTRQQGDGRQPMNHWRDTMVDRPDNDGAVYAAGWTISGLAIIGAIVAVWILGI
jgi:hypothetical protein